LADQQRSKIKRLCNSPAHEGDQLTVKILEIDRTRRRIRLSAKTVL
jgi:ribosomal protein S1